MAATKLANSVIPNISESQPIHCETSSLDRPFFFGIFEDVHLWCGGDQLNLFPLFTVSNMNLAKPKTS